MVTDTGEHPRRDPIPPDWPGDDPTLPEDLAALGHRRALPVRPAARHRRIYREGGPPDDEAPADDPLDLGSPVDDDRDVVDLLPVETSEAEDVLDAVGAGRIGDDRHDAHGGHADADPDDDLVAGVQPAGRVLVVMVLALVLAMLVNADALVARAEQKAPGPGRDRSLAVWHAVQDVSHALQLHRIREVADRLAGDDGDSDAATTGASADPSADAASSTDSADGTDTDARVTPALDPAADAPSPERGGGGQVHAGNGDADAGGVPHLRTPTADEPLRLWVGGDSMAQVFGPALAERASATGVVDATVHYEMASGLTRPDYYDWPRALAADVDEVDAEVVVVVFGVNDAQGIVQPDGTPVPEVGDPRWAPEYRRRVGALMDQLRHDDRLVVWVALPPMREPGYDGRITVVDAAVAAEAATRPWIVLVDSTAALAGAGGTYADAVPDAAGAPVDVRQDDGIHLTIAGGERLAGHVFDAIAGRVDLDGSGDDDGGRD